MYRIIFLQQVVQESYVFSFLLIRENQPPQRLMIRLKRPVLLSHCVGKQLLP
jgi:hypothetical protein